MASNLKNHQGGQESCREAKTNNGAPKSYPSDGNLDAMISSSMDHLHEVPLSLDYNHSFGMKKDSSNKIKTRRFKKEFGKKLLTKMEIMRLYRKNSNPDLDLKLSPPGVNRNNESVSSSSLSWHSCMSMELNPNNVFYKTFNLHAPSLILKGCEHCHIYIMVSEKDPKCPNCKGKNFLDVFHDSPAKKTCKN